MSARKKVRHTLGPLHVGPGIQSFVVQDADDNTVAKTWEKAHAEFIVRACNSHEELLEALEAIRTYGGPLNHIHETMADAAIAKARGEKD